MYRKAGYRMRVGITKGIAKGIGCLLAVSFLAMFNTEQVKAQGSAGTHVESFSLDHDLRGLFSSCEEFFNTGDWQIKNAEFKLYFTATTIVREEVSDFTVLLNDQPVYSQKIPLTAGETQEIKIKLPERLIKPGTNSLRIESYIRTNDEDPCKDDVSGASWMVVTKDSFVSVSYKPLTVCKNIADVYKQMTSLEALETKKSAVFLSPNPSESEMTGAAYILTGMSRNAVLFYDNMALVKAADHETWKNYDYGIYISLLDTLPTKLRSALTQEQMEAAQKGAVLAFVQSDGGPDMIVVTGSDISALQNACRLFGNKESMQQSKLSFRAVTSAEDVKMSADNDTLSILTETGSYVKGPFKQNASFTIPMGANKSIAPESEVEIRFRYAENLDFDRSLVTVYIGDTPIGSKKLMQEKANGDSFKVSIPDNLQIKGSFILNVTFDLEIKGLVCDIRRQDMPWAYVTNESSIRLNTKEVPWFLFEYYPSPFIYEGKMNDVKVILPITESEKDMEAMRRILLTLGRFQLNNSGNISVCRTDNIGDLSKVNVISIGSLSDNPIAKQMNDQLYFKFSPKGTTITSNEKMKIEPNYGSVLGTGQLFYSPYSLEKYALLLVSGVTDTSMMNAVEYLGKTEGLWEVYGDGFVADEELISCYRFGQDNSKEETISERIIARRNVTIFLAVGGCVLGLLILSLILIWNKHRKGR